MRTHIVFVTSWYNMKLTLVSTWGKAYATGCLFHHLDYYYVDSVPRMKGSSGISGTRSWQQEKEEILLDVTDQFHFKLGT